MNDGGSKYYLLEKESISAMIRSTARETYHDLILVNSSGTVLYTMQNETLFRQKPSAIQSRIPPLSLFFVEHEGAGPYRKIQGARLGLGVITYLSTPVTSGDSVQACSFSRYMMTGRSGFPLAGKSGSTARAAPANAAYRYIP
jgi:hypothetical protein